jgi:bifunctional DNA-binding transcriptional regulator/antitoxin component of YhaV-PrlF toxin-antitoxin module
MGMRRGESTLTAQGQLTVPAAVRRKAKLLTGTRVTWLVSDEGVITLRPIRLSPNEIIGSFKSKRVVSGAQIERAIREGYAESE